MHQMPPQQRSITGEVAVGVFLGLWLFTISAVVIGALVLAFLGRSVQTS